MGTPIMDSVSRWYDWSGMEGSFGAPARWGMLILSGNPPGFGADRRWAMWRPILALTAFLLLLISAGGLTFLWFMRRGKTRIEPGKPIASQAVELANRALEIVRREYDTDLRTAEVARRLFVSERHLQRVFQRAKGRKFREFLTETRLENARDLLLSTNLNVTEICFKVGFRDFSTFSRAFHKRFKENPSQLRGVMPDGQSWARRLSTIPRPTFHPPISQDLRSCRSNVAIPTCFLRQCR